ncbi:Uncharacterized protein aq_1978 [hydrothermal vent metagenome]|uniref:Uncharacterized protein aq_1978 n=1 Tax=hydrothermal vent metagenome TaxID=652676 RepID=A0A1W1BZ17_9ZZZZ
MWILRDLNKKIAIVTLISTLFFVGCSDHSKVVFPNKGYQNVKWSKEEMAKEIAIKHISKNEYSSTDIIRLKGSEPPHFHDYHNLAVTMLSGESVIHFKDHETILEKGDVLFIPKGVYHWAENIDSDGSVVFAIFSPAYNGKDMRISR